MDFSLTTDQQNIRDAVLKELEELVVRGGHVMQGYWEKPEDTARALRPGAFPWERVLHSGDFDAPSVDSNILRGAKNRGHHREDGDGLHRRP